jgi:2-polyprenyl-3-methyl-5-hydroxy-6-metoxy-1,4-benzoquinol methylase
LRSAPLPRLGKRFRNDGEAARQLNALQREARGLVEQKIREGIYRFEHVDCAVCDGDHFETLSEKDRYGLEMSVSICVDCGLIQTIPRMDQASYARFYDAEYRRLYLGAHGPTAAYVAGRWERGREIYDFLFGARGVAAPPTRPLSVVEVGCGGGGILKYFRDQGHAEWGVDPGSEYVRFSRETYGLNLHVGTIADIPDTVRADVILYSHVFEHILSPAEEIRHIRRLLSDEGIVFVEVPGVKNIHRVYGRDFLQYVQNAHTYHYTLRTLRNLFERHGFEMLAGDETILSVFRRRRPGISRSAPVNDHTAVLRYLAATHRKRRAMAVLLAAYAPVKRLPVVGRATGRVLGAVRKRAGV